MVSLRGFGSLNLVLAISIYVVVIVSPVVVVGVVPVFMVLHCVVIVVYCV